MKKFLSAILAVVMILSAAPICRVVDNDFNIISVSASAAQLNGLNKTNGKWYYYKNGKIDKSFEGMAKNQYGWWYVKNGTIDFSYTGMAKNQYGWWYMKSGKLDTTYTGMAKNQYGWWYMKNGKLDTTYTGMAKNEYGWWYMKNGKLDRTYTGMAKNQYGWWYLKNGTIDFTYTGIAKNQYGYWYISDGKLDTSINCIYIDDYDTPWSVINGKSQKIYKNTIVVDPNKLEITDNEYTDIIVYIYAPDGCEAVSFYLENDDDTIYCEWNDWEYYDGEYAIFLLDVYGNNVGTEKIGFYFDDDVHDIKATTSVTVLESEELEEYTLEMPDCPQTISYYLNNEILYTVEITDIECEFYQNSDYFSTELIITGTKTYDKNPDEISDCDIGYRIYDDDGVVVDNGVIYLHGISQGEDFVYYTSISSYDIEPGNYRLELLSIYY